MLIFLPLVATSDDKMRIRLSTDLNNIIDKQTLKVEVVATSAGGQEKNRKVGEAIHHEYWELMQRGLSPMGIGMLADGDYVLRQEFIPRVVKIDLGMPPVKISKY